MAGITVIVPIYNTELYLQRCIDSILAQTLRDFDVILVDDGSSDHSGEICDAYVRKDPRVHVIHQCNGGRSAARNAGLEWSLNGDCDWITFVDSDDWIHPQYLEFLYLAATRSNTRISSCAYSKVYAYKTPEMMEKPEITLAAPERLWCSNRVNAAIAVAKLYARECFSSIRYPDGKIHEDEFVTYRILFRYDSISQVHAVLYYYFQNENGIMLSQWTEDRLAALDACLEQVSFFSDNGFTGAAGTSCAVFARTCAKSLDMIEKHVSDKIRRKSLQEKWLPVLQSFIREHREQLTIRGNPRAMIYAIPGFYDICCWTRACFRRMKNGKQQEKRGI